MIHGDMDEVISVKSSLWAYNKLPHTRKKLILLHEGHHRLLMDEGVSWTCYQNMKLFFQGLLLPDEEPEMAADIMPALLEEKSGGNTPYSHRSSQALQTISSKSNKSVSSCY